MGKYVILLVVLLVLVLGAGGGLVWLLMGSAGSADDDLAPPTPTIVPAVEVTNEVEGGEITVNEVSVVILDSDPVQAFAVVKGAFEDGCSRLSNQFVKLDGRVFTVYLSSEMLDETDCDASENVFEESVSLPVDGLADGTYSVDVNGVVEEFVLGEEERPTPTVEPTVEPVDGGVVRPTNIPDEGDDNGASESEV